MPETVLEPLQSVADSMPPAIVIAFGIAWLIGLIVWLLGRALAKPACVLSGLAFGAMGGAMLGHAVALQGVMLLAGVIGAGLAGALLAAGLFRLWVAGVGAVLLALIVPAGLLVWTGTPTPIDAATQPLEEKQGAETPDEQAAPTESGGQRANAEADADFPPTPTNQADAGNGGEGQSSKKTGIPSTDEVAAATQPSDAVDLAIRALRGLYQQQVEAVTGWWDELDNATRERVGYGSAIGALVGLLLGLAAPFWAASLESAVAGAMLMFFPGRALLARWFPEQAGWLPQSPRAVILCVLGLAGLGVLFQHLLAGRKKKKDD